jgi:hypothetical protein
MNQELLKQAALELDELLRKYAPIHDDAAKLQRAVEGCVRDALAGLMQVPVHWQDIPGGRLFDETNLRQCDGLQSAYAHFKIQATGGEKPGLTMLKARMQKKIAQGS